VALPIASTAADSVDTRVRRKVLAMTVTLAAITYLDRVAIGVARPHIARDLQLDSTQMGYVFSAFYLSYALFEIPTGWWGDRVGTRRVLTRIVCWWSSFTVLTGFAFSYPSLLAVRFLFGAGEAGAWPNVARTFSRWFPRRERGTVQGIFFMGAHLMGGLTPLLATALLGIMDWRTMFLLFGSIGFIWALAWFRWFRDGPSEHPDVSAAERAYIEDGAAADSGHLQEATQWKRLLANRTVVCLCLMYFTQTFGNAFYVTWLPTYLASRGLTGVTGSILAGCPLMFSVAADFFGGVTTDRAVKRLGLRLGRIRYVHVIAGCVGVADCAWRRLVEFSARFGLGHVSRHRGPAGGFGERGHEHVGPGWRDFQSHSRGVRGSTILELECAAVSDGRSLPAGCDVLAVGRSYETGFRLMEQR